MEGTLKEIVIFKLSYDMHMNISRTLPSSATDSKEAHTRAVELGRVEHAW